MFNTPLMHLIPYLKDSRNLTSHFWSIDGIRWIHNKGDANQRACVDGKRARWTGWVKLAIKIVDIEQVIVFVASQCLLLVHWWCWTIVSASSRSWNSGQEPILFLPRPVQWCLALFHTLKDSRWVRTTSDHGNIRFNWKRGPTSASWISPGILTNTWCLWSSESGCKLTSKFNAYRNEMKSSSFANVMTRLLSSLGTGNKNLSTSLIRIPRFEVNCSNIRCGYCSDTVDDLYEPISWRRATLWSEKWTVGPWGKWETIIASEKDELSGRNASRLLTWDTPVFVQNNKVGYIVGATCVC